MMPPSTARRRGGGGGEMVELWQEAENERIIDGIEEPIM